MHGTYIKKIADNIKECPSVRKWEGVVGTGWSWLRIGTGGRYL